MLQIEWSVFFFLYHVHSYIQFVLYVTEIHCTWNVLLLAYFFFQCCSRYNIMFAYSVLKMINLMLYNLQKLMSQMQAPHHTKAGLQCCHGLQYCTEHTKNWKNCRDVSMSERQMPTVSNISICCHALSIEQGKKKRGILTI